MKYIDIHTHHAQPEPEILAIRSFVFGEETIQLQQPFSVGMHPWYLQHPFARFKHKIQSLKDHPNLMAIGECGLDFQSKYLQIYPPDFQEQIFVKQIYLAHRIHKPLIIHCVKCFDRLLQIKKENPFKIPWIIHGYAKNAALAEQLLSAGFYLSFGAMIFRSESNRKALKKIPLNRLFLETDDQNQFTIQNIYSKAAQILSIDLMDLQKQIMQNFIRVFLGNQ